MLVRKKSPLRAEAIASPLPGLVGLAAALRRSSESKAQYKRGPADGQGGLRATATANRLRLRQEICFTFVALKRYAGGSEERP